MRMQFSPKLHAHAIVHAIFGAYNIFMMGVYQLVWTSVMMSRELMNKISLWNPFFEERKLGSFSFVFFGKSFVFTSVKSNPKTLEKSGSLVLHIHMREGVFNKQCKTTQANGRITVMILDWFKTKGPKILLLNNNLHFLAGNVYLLIFF